MPSALPSEVKGAWFITARRLIHSEHADSLPEILQHIDPIFRDAITDPLPSAWYPEEALEQLLAAIYRVLAKSDRDKFIRLMELAIRHFFRLMLRMSAPAFVLRHVPTMWNQIRRGRGKVTVDIGERKALIRYTDFPYFADPLYRWLTEASLRALMRICQSRETEVRIAEHGPDWLTLSIDYARSYPRT